MSYKVSAATEYTGVEVRQSKLGGLGLFATKFFAPGEPIISEEPFLNVVGLEWECMDAALCENSKSSSLIVSSELNRFAYSSLF